MLRTVHATLCVIRVASVGPARGQRNDLRISRRQMFRFRSATCTSRCPAMRHYMCDIMHCVLVGGGGEEEVRPPYLFTPSPLPPGRGQLSASPSKTTIHFSPPHSPFFGGNKHATKTFSPLWGKVGRMGREGGENIT